MTMNDDEGDDGRGSLAVVLEGGPGAASALVKWVPRHLLVR
jgi:hypothetical protein